MALLTNLCGSVPTTMANITDACFNMAEVQRIYFQRTYSTGTTENSFTIATANPNVIASWTSLLSAADGTKVLAPNTVIHAPTFTKGNKIEFGGNGETAGGIPIYMGHEPGQFTCSLLYRAAQTIEGYINLTGENLSIYLELEDGRIIGQVDDNASPTTFKGIKIEQIAVGDREGDNRTQPGFNTLDFYLPFRWSKFLHAITPSDYTARTQIVN